MSGRSLVALSPGRPGGTPAGRVKDRSPTNPGPEKMGKVQKACGSQLVVARERTEEAGGEPPRKSAGSEGLGVFK